MKMKPEHYKVLKDAAAKVLETVGGFEQVHGEYRRAGYSDKRFRWDLLYATRLQIGSVTAPGDLNLYDYLDDTHIDTALKKITGTK